MWQSVWSAAQEYRTILVSLVHPDAPASPVPREIEDLGIEVIPIPHRPPSTLAAAWSGIAGRWPLTLARFRSEGLRSTLGRLVETRRPAFALVNHLHLATYVDDLGRVPMVLREHNVEYLWMERYARAQGLGPRGLYARVQAGRLRAAEARLCGRASLVLAIQAREAEILQRLAPHCPVRVVPIGIDFARFGEPCPAQPPVVLIAGSFAWEPNSRGALRFLQEGWPRLRALAPEVRLRLAGKGPPAELVEAAERGGAETTGYVASMSEEFARASVLLVPLWVGAGARVKIVEAIAAQLPVVSTPLGAEGLGLIGGRDYVEADSPEALAEGVAGVLRAPDRGRAGARSARALAAESRGLPAVAALQNRYCAEVAG